MTIFADAARGESFWDLLAGYKDLLILVAGFALIAFIVRYVKGSATMTRGFVIRVAGDDVQFSGQFPPNMEAMVTDFLREDVAANADYEVRGHWEGTMLVVVVKGDGVRPMEQRIRNFLKLNIKPPR